MFAFAHDESLDPAELADFFSRAGWSSPDAGPAVEWALAAAEDWVTCTIEGRLVGFGRTCLLDGVHRLAFDVVVDVRFRGFGLDDEIVRRLARAAGGRTLSVFRSSPAGGLVEEHPAAAAYVVPDAPHGTYLG